MPVLLQDGFYTGADASISGLGPYCPSCKKMTRYTMWRMRVVPSLRAALQHQTLAVVWAISHFHTYLYGHSVVVYTDHSAVRAVLGSSNPAKHAHWWTKVYGSGIRDLKIHYRPGKTNANADTLSRSAQAPSPSEGIGEAELQVAVVQSGLGLTQARSSLFSYYSGITLLWHKWTH